MNHSGRHRFAVRRHAPGVSYLLLLALLLRSLVPLGTMPDAGALRAGRIPLVLCSGAGVTLAPAAIGAPGDEEQAPAGGADCAFSLLSHQALAVVMPAAALTLPLVFLSVSAPCPEAPALPVGAQGPPLGSRAPPLPSC